MATVSLGGVRKVTAKGRAYWYYGRGKGAVRLPAPDEPGFAEALAAARSGGPVDDKHVRGLCALYRASDDFKDLAPGTRKNWAPWLDKIQDHFGKLSIAQFDRPKKIRPHIRKWHRSYSSTPRAADMGLQVLSRLMSFAVDENLLDANPCADLPRLYRSDRSDLIWTDDDMTRLERVASPEVFRAAKLAALTGLRQSDLLRLSWSHVGDLAIEIRTGKSRGLRTATVPVYAELRRFLETLPRVGPVVLVNSDGRPWRSGFTSSWNKTMKRADFGDLHFHDLRGTFATRVYLAGVADEADKISFREIGEILAWSEERVERIINRYVRRDALLRERIRRLDRTGTEQEAGKPSGKQVS